MEAHKKGEGGDLAALFSSDGSVNMAELCEKISKRLAHFLCLISLLGLYFFFLLSHLSL